LTKDILGAMVYVDAKDTSARTIYLDQPELALPLSVYKDPENENVADLIDAYKTFVREAAQYFDPGVSNGDADDVADAIFDFEVALAEVNSLN